MFAYVLDELTCKQARLLRICRGVSKSYFRVVRLLWYNRLTLVHALVAQSFIVGQKL